MSKKIHTSKALIVAGLVALPALNAVGNEETQSFQMVDQGLQHIANSRDIAVPGWTSAFFLDINKENKGFAYTHCPQDDKNETFIYTNKLEISRYMWWNYSSNKKVEEIYASDKAPAKYIRNPLHEINFLPKEKKTYQGEPLADSYNQGMPMSWYCDSVEGFRHFAAHLKTHTKPATKKPSILLIIKNDPALLTVSKEDKDFLAEYFNLPASEQEAIDLKDFFAQSRRSMRDKTGDVEGAGAKPGYDSFAYSVFAELAKRLKQGETDKLGYAIFGFALWAIDKRLEKFVMGTMDRGFDAAASRINAAAVGLGLRKPAPTEKPDKPTATN